MRQRGRKSSARLSVVPVSIDAQRPSPPKELTPGQADLWKQIVATSPGGWFRDGECADTGNWLSKLINDEPRKPLDLRRLNRILAMRSREDALLLNIATKMRLTPQARIQPRSAGRAFDNGQSGRALWERPKPWE